MRTKTILAAVAATLIAAVGVTAPALGSAGGSGASAVVTPMMKVDTSGSICC